MYRAIEIAKYVINRCIDNGNPISNLQLQKILYYVQGAYINYTRGECLFNDKMEAWQYGPVVPEVYYTYCIYSSTRITDRQDEEVSIDNRTKNIIDPVIDNKSRVSAWSLVQSSHNERPWIDNYNENSRNTITIESLQSQFMQ